MKVIVIGAGLGGLSTAITLANLGHSVEIFEKNEHVGGKLMEVTSNNGFRFDFGPNTITMPQIFKQVIEQTGERAEDYFELVKLDRHTRNIFADGTSFDFSSNKEVMLSQLKSLDPHGFKNLERFLREVRQLYNIAEHEFFPKIFSSLPDFLSPRLSRAFMRVRPFQTLDSFFRIFFKNEQVIQAFNRYATYIGSSPYLTPATFALIAHLELNQGVYYVKGGNYNIARGFEKVAKKLGVKIHTSTSIKEVLVENRQAVGVLLENGEKVGADAVIANADLLTTYQRLIPEVHRPSFPDSKIFKYDPSISAFVILAGVSKQFDKLLHHNVYFSSNYKREFTEIFKEKIYSDDPTIYICNSAFTDSTAAIEGGSNLFILVNAPALRKENGLQVNPEHYKNIIYDKLQEQGLDIRSHLSYERVITPSDIASSFAAFRGALYGISSNHRTDAFFRPSNVSPDVRGLYFVGGTTHPGGGSPMVTLGGLNVGKYVDRKHGKVGVR
ncbi:phytoene desaturase [Bacillus sp. HMF5848]|uniref:phytoene desaturase family protein n=1 Tax=Bacillus sp. HMF5848 TaxID=2495421 RepID=UPI000F79943F|nr:phytoene desaturase family protein [Bacillus sp. HMF5848]RSK26391.1 phytoene desaturase [Bacillus sp. HMF5848]